jgi:FtsZ-binding cell division protein ZapB
MNNPLTQEVEELRHRLHTHEMTIEELQAYRDKYNEDYIDERINDNLNEAMEYLEMKDMEIDRLRKENDRFRMESYT